MSSAFLDYLEYLFVNLKQFIKFYHQLILGFDNFEDKSIGFLLGVGFFWSVNVVNGC